jgi:hypothetical protein
MAEPSSKIIFTGIVKDNEDTYLLGRIRVFPQNQDTIKEVIRGCGATPNDSETDIIDSEKYGPKDPFVYMPLLPSFVNLIPSVDELVWVMYSNPSANSGYKEQFYFPVIKSSPFNIGSEDYEQQKSNTAEGFNIAPGIKFKSDVPDETTKKPYSSEKTDIKGIFAEPEDIGIYSKGTTDIILQPNTALIRAGKVVDMTPNIENPKNQNRGFLQISSFKTRSENQDPETSTTSEINQSPLIKLIEYQITNLENMANAFSGNITIYNILPPFSVNNNEFTSTYDVPLASKGQVWSYSFTALNLLTVHSLVNDVINALNNGGSELKTKYPNIPEFNRLFTSIQEWGAPQIYPYYYRPSFDMRQILGKTPDPNVEGPEIFQKYLNAQKIIAGIRFVRAILNLDVDGSGLVSQKDKFGISRKNKTVTKQERSFIPEPNSTSILGGNKLLLISHDSVIPGLKQISLGRETLYGLSQNEIDNVLSNTNSMVRGEKLKEFLNLLMRFLLTHVHAYHGIPPNPTSFSEVTIGNIEEAFQKYDTDVLNQNIRIN